MKNGLKVFDTDTHAAPSAETLRPYLAAKVIERIPDLDEQRVPIRTNRAGKTLQAPYKHWFRIRGPGAEEASGWGSQKPRYLGEAGPREGGPEHVAGASMGRHFPARRRGGQEPAGPPQDTGKAGRRRQCKGGSGN